MKIVLFGATGNIGSRILAEALSRGHHVTAVARDPSKLTLRHDHLVVVRGDVFEPEALRSAAGSRDALVSSLSPPADPKPGRTYVDAARNLVGLVAAASIGRLLFVGGAGSLEVAPGLRLIDSPDFPASWKPAALTAIEVLDLLKRSEIDWTFFSPAALIVPGERTGKFRLGDTKLVVDEKGESKVSMEDYAVALVDELEKRRYSRKQFTVAY